VDGHENAHAEAPTEPTTVPIGLASLVLVADLCEFYAGLD